MIALGNDVVDLNWHPRNGQRYFDKVASYAFSTFENSTFSKYILTREGNMLLWSIKEACYKSAVKLGSAKQFIPKDFAISNIELRDGFFYSTINHTENTLLGRSVILKSKIHSVTIHKSYDFDEIAVNDQSIATDNYSDQHQAVRNLFRKNFSNKHDLSVTFSKNALGVPFVLLEGVVLSLDISFSHHGKMVGYARTL